MWRRGRGGRGYLSVCWLSVLSMRRRGGREGGENKGWREKIIFWSTGDRAAEVDFRGHFHYAALQWDNALAGLKSGAGRRAGEGARYHMTVYYWIYSILTIISFILRKKNSVCSLAPKGLGCQSAVAPRAWPGGASCRFHGRRFLQKIIACIEMTHAGRKSMNVCARVGGPGASPRARSQGAEQGGRREARVEINGRKGVKGGKKLR